MNKFFLLILVLLGLNACFPLTSNSLKKVNVNDSKEKVIGNIGKPYSERIYYNKEYMVYYVHDSLFSLFFNTREFPFIGFYPFLRTGVEYWIILEDGRVVASGTSRNFLNNVPRALSNGGSSGVLEVFEN